MSTRTKVLGGIGLAAIAILAIGGGLTWYTFLRDDAPPEVSLAGALDALASASETAAPTSGAATATVSAEAPGGSAASQTEGLDGTWSVDDSLDSFVGYRVGEELVSVGVTTAVGRTPGVAGEVTIASNTVTAATIEADMTRLASDDSRRDGQLRRQAIETDTYPTSTFELTGPIELPDGVVDGEAFSVTLPGNLTLHGVTNAVTIAADGQLSGENLVVVGSIEIVFAEYDIEKPSGGSVVSIEDTGIMELQLFLKRA